ncbi:MAG: DUF4389 domain-containing protein [Nocardioidaceae bacterium]
MNEGPASTHPAYPLRMEARLEAPLSRWLWLVKVILLIPHIVVLAFLWIAFVILTVFVFFAILFTGRYPRTLFDFNVGVLRWTWRVSYYGYSALGTDRYPPFTLHDVPDYPTDLWVEYPDTLSRPRVLVKWLLALPHLLIVSVFVGAGAWGSWQAKDLRFGGWSLVGLLVLIAGLSLLFRNRYPTSIFDLVLGLNRWSLRVAAYAALMTDTYPPFRLDQGGGDSGGASADEHLHAPAPSPAVPRPGELRSSEWTLGRGAFVVIGSFIVFTAFGLTTLGIAALAIDNTMRDNSGFLEGPDRHFVTTTYALATDPIELSDRPFGRDGPGELVGDVRLQAVSIDPSVPVFIGVAPSSEVSNYLEGVSHATITDPRDTSPDYVIHPGAAPAQPPTATDIWAVSASGPGTQSLVWTPDSGRWTIVAMNAAGSPGVDVTVQAGVEAPHLARIGVVAMLIALIPLLIGSALIYTGVHLARRAAAHPSHSGPGY